MEPNNPETATGASGGIWPPPPLGQHYASQALTFPFKTLFSYVKGSVPNFRVGTVTLYPEGFSIQGKAVIRYEIQVPILIACFLLRLGFFIAYVVMEYAIRRDETLSVAWADVRSLVLVPKKNRVCLVYDAPNYKGIVKTYSLAFKLEPGQYESFVSNVGAFIPERVAEGKLRAWTSPKVWVFCGGALAGLLILLVIYLMTPHVGGQ